MTSTTKLCSGTRQWGDILSGEPLGLVCESACDPSDTANVDLSKNKTNTTHPSIQINQPPDHTKQKPDKNQRKITEIGVIQINLHKSKAATSLLSQKLLEKIDSLHIALITEPHTSRGRIPNIDSKHHDKIYPSTIEAPRACIIIKKTLQYIEITELQSRDTTAVLVDTSTTTGKKQTIFASIYQPPQYDNQPPTQEMRKIVNYATTNNLPLIIGCDTNGHHQMWGSKENNKRGNNLAEYILSVNLQSVNEGNTPTFVSANGETIIDVTFSTSNIANKIKNWHVANEETLSDHKYIKFKVSSETETVKPHFNPRKTNWDKFRGILKRTNPATQPFPTCTDELEQDVYNLTSALHTAFVKSTHNNNTVRQYKSKWWTAELKRQKRITNRALNNFNNNKCDETWNTWKSEKKVLDTTIRREKRRAWRTYTSNIEQLQEAQRLTKILDKGPTQRINLLKKPDGTSTKNTEEALQLLLDTHFPGNETMPNESNTQTQPSTNRHITANEWHKAGQLITDAKIKWAINELQPYKSPGSDGIYPVMLQKSIDIIQENLHNILRACIAYGYIPKEWRISKAIFIPKPGKDNYDNAKAFRPISLTSFLLKTMEKILDRELRDTTLNVNPLNPNQHAYQTGKSTETALHALTTKIAKATENKEYALCTFFDIAGAFDNAPAKTILNALRTRNANPLISKWIENLLKTRIVTTTKGSTTKTAKATRGCPQGGVLSPLLWCLVVDELLTKLKNLHIDIQAYSDDGTITVTGKDLKQICAETQKGINIASDWCKNNDLTIHPNKTNMVLFTNKKKTDGWNSPTIGNVTIPLQSSFKYLGVTLDQKLNFKEHIKQKCASTTRTFFQTKQAIAGTWGLSPKIVKWLYITVIRPRISYASIIWWDRCILTQAKAILQKTQRLATVSITGAMKTTPTIALDSISGLTPLHIYIGAEAMKSYTRMKGNNAWIPGICHGHRIIEHLTKNSIPIEDHITDFIKKTYRFYKNYNIMDANETKDTNTEDVICHTYSSRTNLTDIKSGAISNQWNYSATYYIKDRITTSHGEMLAITNLCKEILTRPERSIRIICDHIETIKSLMAVYTKSKITLECIDQLNETSKNKSISIQLRTTHTPYPTQGEQTDIKERETTRNENIGISYKEMTKHIEAWTKQNHIAHFESYPEGRSTKANIGNPYSPKLQNLCERTRKDLRMITHILTGHSWLNKHMNTISICNTPICQQCQLEEETTAHFLYTCPELHEVRKSIFGTPIITQNTKPIKDLEYNKLIAYCKASNRFDPPTEDDT